MRIFSNVIRSGEIVHNLVQELKLNATLHVLDLAIDNENTSMKYISKSKLDDNTV